MTNDPMDGHTSETAAYVSTHWLIAIGHAYQTDDHETYRELLQHVDPGAAPLILSAVLPSFFRATGLDPEHPTESPESDEQDGDDHE